MRLKYDWHTHTTYSHGKGSIADNVKAAYEIGLESIAIADHGPGHFGFGFKRSDIERMRADIDELQPLYPDMKIYLSAEANIINSSGELDINGVEQGKFDFILAGYHFGTIGENPAKSIVLHAKNLLNGKTGRWPSKLVLENTELLVKALYNNKISILTHPGDKGAVFIEEVAKACAAKGTLMEISNHHLHLTVDDIKICAGYDVKFIIGSDAHKPENVGRFDVAYKKISEAGLDPERVVNLQI